MEGRSRYQGELSMEDRLRSNLLVLRSDQYIGYLLTIAVLISAVEVGVVACAPGLGQVALAIGWTALVVAAFVRLQKVKMEYQLTSGLELYRVVVGIVSTAFLGWISFISLSSAPQAMRLPLLTAAKFILLQNMFAAPNAVIVALLSIYMLDRTRELKGRLR